MALKALISSPLEAGTSILDAHRLPPYFTPALEYTSKRLARKGLHVTLVVARRDYQLPGCTTGNDTTAIPTTTTTTTTTTTNAATDLPTPPASPASPDVVPCGPNLTAFKSLVRSGTDPNLGSSDKSNMKPPQRSKTTLLATKKASLASLFDSGLASPRLRWPMTPKTPSGIPQTPRTPATPATPASSITTASSNMTSFSTRGAPEAPPSSIRLIYTAPLDSRADKLVMSTLARANRKFNLGGSLSARDAATYDLQPDVLHRSIIQNELLFSSEGLTLLSLDHLYTFKRALAHYSAGTSEAGSDFRLEDAVDELRRCVLSSSRRLLKSVLVGCYGWLGAVDEVALGDVMRMYCRAYGGMTGDTGVEDDICKAEAVVKTLEGGVRTRPIVPPPPPPPPPKSGVRSTRVVAAAAAAAAASPIPTPSTSAEDLAQSPQNWIVEDVSPMGDEGAPDTPRVTDKVLSHVEEQNALQEAEQVDSEKTQTSPKADVPKTAPEQAVEQQGLTTPGSPSVSPSTNLPRLTGKVPSPRASPKASLPTLKIQTSFHKPKPLPVRKTTPMPKRVTPQEKKKQSTPLPLRANHEDAIEIVLHATDDGDNDDDDDDGEATDFEDGDLTARPPPSAVTMAGGAFWAGGSIDEMLGDRQIGDSGVFSFRYHRRTSSLGLSPVQQQQHEGPMTPNGYEDISPITRGEWGFLMVSDPFKTKTAAVETF
ncbi:hypothetical protein VP1G_09839 [Cytospora mali]|uniref:DUF7582 domain-containing protein n=1 Tax=Cytospora mali TaxID=578113 RepID=A0A194VFU4_CYTMA|nr:hypothetical protein VP1G_09839 [Valsa mali var. pyri (nom. inval.)]